MGAGETDAPLGRGRCAVSKLVALVVVLVASACNSREVVAVIPGQDVVDHTGFPLDDNRDVDILFVVDNSNSMEAEQAELAGNFRAIIDALERDGELPSVHIGVISTDVGGPPGGACTSGNEGAGLLRVEGKSCRGTNDETPFLFDRVDEDGVRTRNYDGELRDAFACMAELGIGGCGFEQPLEAVRLALEAPENQGFFRDHAYLAIIFVTDEDDCSVTEEARLLTDLGDRSPAVLESELGPFTSFRCFELGVTCDGPGDPRSPGLRRDCVPRVGSPYLQDVDRFVEAVRARKQLANQILVAAIAGDLEPVEVEMRRLPDSYDFDVPMLAYSCEETGLGEAVPPVRLAAFIEGFPLASRLTSICDDNLTGAVDEIVRLFRQQFGPPCLAGEPLDTDPTTLGLQPECVVIEVTAPGTDEERERVLPECDDPGTPLASSELPCFLLVPNPECDEHPTGLEVQVHYAEGVQVPAGTRAEVSCVSQRAEP